MAGRYKKHKSVLMSGLTEEKGPNPTKVAVGGVNRYTTTFAVLDVLRLVPALMAERLSEHIEILMSGLMEVKGPNPTVVQVWGVNRHTKTIAALEGCG
jgi:hypothetical protein